MDRKYVLRDSCADDAEVIVTWFEGHRAAMNWGGEDVPNPLTATWIAEQFLDRHRRYFTLTNSDGGVCGAYFLYHMPGEQRLHLGRFAVAPALRRRGLGSFMLDYAKSEAKSAGVKWLTLYVYEHNQMARTLYERAGFYVPTDTAVDRNPGGTALPMRFDISNEGTT